MRHDDPRQQTLNRWLIWCIDRLWFVQAWLCQRYVNRTHRSRYFIQVEPTHTFIRFDPDLFYERDVCGASYL